MQHITGIKSWQYQGCSKTYCLEKTAVCKPVQIGETKDTPLFLKTNFFYPLKWATHHCARGNPQKVFSLLLRKLAISWMVGHRLLPFAAQTTLPRSGSVKNFNLITFLSLLANITNSPLLVAGEKKQHIWFNHAHSNLEAVEFTFPKDPNQDHHFSNASMTIFNRSRY